MAIKKEVRIKLLKLLPKNYRKVLAEQCRVHEQTIGNVLYGRTTNLKVELAILQLAKDTREARAKETSEIQHLADQLLS